MAFAGIGTILLVDSKKPVNSFMNNLPTVDSKKDVETSPCVNISMNKVKNLRVFSTGRRISLRFRTTQEEANKKREKAIKNQK